LMTGFILNGLSESLLSSRLFRIKAWVLQVLFLSMIFLYFFDYSNLNHSKVFYLFFVLIKNLHDYLDHLGKLPILPTRTLNLIISLLCPYYSLLLSCPQFQSAPFILYLFLLDLACSFFALLVPFRT